ncbi:hypothetical protein V5799_004178 [Amblyomma americanum]|uniref:Uncharacterized protein n=1 Tax=Amblyomma americanum TaxID=6943 RepID=A0AAQ4D6U9_AMBAM
MRHTTMTDPSGEREQGAVGVLPALRNRPDTFAHPNVSSLWNEVSVLIRHLGVDMVRFSSASIRSEIFGYASFMDGVKIISTFHRYLRYSYFSKTVHGESRLSATTCSPYLAFAVASCCLYALVMVQDAYHVAALKQDEGGERIRVIDKCVLMFYFVRCVGIQLANILTLVTYSHELCQTVNKMEAIESTFQRPTRLRPTAKFIVLLNVIFSVTALFSM